MQPRDLRYFLAYTVPVCAALGLLWHGAWAWLTPLVVFGAVPLLEQLVLPRPKPQPEEPATASAAYAWVFDGLLYLNVPLQYGLLGWYLHTLSTQPLNPAELAGLTASQGICCGVLGINVAHELGHRANRLEQLLAQALLLSSLYLHFFIEHNRGHHRHVGTPLDPATARFGESLYPFVLRSMWGGWRSAWHLEATRLQRAGQAVWHPWHNQMLRFQLLQVLAVLAVGAGLGWQAALGFVVVAFLGGALLEAVNYVEHYGLQRREVRPGVYERVQPHHSWNAEQPLGRILLYELTRHSDHHYLASRPYHALRYQPTSPQMPAGYPAMLLLALVPPLWHHVMDARTRALAVL
ncbi:alkane 1-monooxygenase [Hymenobacter latericus]|uniref:alkane 1-monooxygenase n=1 Tax=Hymenobacter sp. YIM 151858-1 TaxID=2987688 RepID=UPI0022278557|nr:alkane 1-monooxygenase [Hymenobacter sp. YIM 151858-1]UYZ57544.1 alkane 1-monooxygenase [Hymenobacter sp. YIM 151858-1]